MNRKTAFSLRASTFDQAFPQCQSWQWFWRWNLCGATILCNCFRIGVELSRLVNEKLCPEAFLYLLSPWPMSGSSLFIPAGGTPLYGHHCHMFRQLFFWKKKKNRLFLNIFSMDDPVNRNVFEIVTAGSGFRMMLWWCWPPQRKSSDADG